VGSSQDVIKNASLPFVNFEINGLLRPVGVELLDRELSPYLGEGG